MNLWTKNGDLTWIAFVLGFALSAALAVAVHWRVGGFDYWSDIKSAAVFCAVLAPIGWTLVPVGIWRAWWERPLYVFGCVMFSILAIVGVGWPELLLGH